MILTADNGEHSFTITVSEFHASGGEADIHLQGPYLLKVYRRPNAIPLHDPDYATKVAAARRRLDEGPRKLSQFPLDLHSAVVSPMALLYDGEGQFAGFVMPYIDNAKTLHDLLEDPDTDLSFLMKVFVNLRAIMLAVHEAGVVIADVAPKNVLVTDDAAVRLIDADSMQFGPFMSPAITRSYTDPLRFGKARDPFQWPTPQSDWYSYAAMLFQALFRIRPFEGEMKPGQPYLEFEERIRRRVTAFHNGVRLPATARPFNIVPAPVMDYFAALFERDVREPFRTELLDMLAWKTCSRHHVPYARKQCPQCIDAQRLRQMSTQERQAYRPVAPEVFLPGRKLTCFTTTGRILAATAQGRLRVLYREGGTLYREHGLEVVKDWPPAGLLSKQAAYAIRGGTSIVAANGVVRAYSKFDAFRDSPLTSVSGRHMLAMNGGTTLVLDGREVKLFNPNARRLRQFLSIPTAEAWLWTGSRKGFVMWEGGDTEHVAEGILFDTGGLVPGTTTKILIDRPSGVVKDVACYFGADRMWLLIMVQSPGGKMRMQIRVYNLNGDLLYKVRYPVQGYFSRVHGHAAVGKTLMVFDDTTLVKLSVEGGELKVIGALPRALPFIQPQTWLLPATDDAGYAVHVDSITPISIRTP